MKHLNIFLVIALLVACKNDGKESQPNEKQTESIVAAQDSLIYPEEVHFKSIRQVTFGGDNAEAYWSFDDKQLIFQSNYKKWGVECDQMFLMDAEQQFDSIPPPMISTGKGRTTCAYFLPDNKHFVYGSTHLEQDKCPDAPLRKNGKYVWPIYDSYDIFMADLEGNIVKQLTDEKGYDA